MNTRHLPLFLLALLIGCGLFARALAGTAGYDQCTRRSWEQLNPKTLKLHSKATLIVDEFGNRLYAKKPDSARPTGST